VAAALDFLHQLCYVHRAVERDNILVEEAGAKTDRRPA
jgi:hypothetical protein